MIVRPTVLGGILIAIIVLVAASAVIIWRASERIHRSNQLAEQLLLVYQHNVGKTVARTDGDDAITAPVPLPPNPPLVQDTSTTAADAAEQEWRERFGLKPDGLAS